MLPLNPLIRSRAPIALPALVLMLTVGRSQAAEAPATWSVTAGTEVGHDDSRGSLAGVDYLGTGGRGFTFGVSGLHSVTPPTSTNSNDTQTSTTSAQGYLRYGVDALRGGFTLDSTSDADYRHSRQLSATLHAGTGSWAVDAAVSRRTTRFESFPVDADVGTRVTVPVEAAASCALNDTGVSGTLTYAAGAWTVYGSGAVNHYQDTTCSFGVDVPPALLRLSRGNFQSLSGALFNRAQLRSGGQIGDQSQLLKSQAGAGISRGFGRGTVALDYQHAIAEFGGAAQDGYSMSGTLPVWKTLAMKLTLGNTIIDSASSPYVGLYAIAQF